MPKAYTAARRHDVFAAPRRAFRGVRRPLVSSADQARGVDAAGRFVGPNDLERALDYFFSQPHRRGSAPLVRSAEFSFGSQDSEPRGGRPLGAIDFDQLRSAYERYAGGAGESISEIARSLGVTFHALAYHLRGSRSMRAALAATSDQATSDKASPAA